jgi:glycopeptide antibiotics resistance protein
VVFFGLAILGESHATRIPVSVIGGVLGLIVYEFLQPFLVHGVFDWTDVNGTLLGGLIALQLYALFEKRTMRNAGSSR